MQGKSLTKREIALQMKAKTKQVGECWEWQAGLHGVGYACVASSFGGGRYGHRAMYEAVVGPIPKGMYVLHSCDNRKCVNPAHLRVGTHLENIRDMQAKLRHRGGSLPNEKNPNHKFSNATICRIRELAAQGVPKRVIERECGVSETQYYRIVKNESRKLEAHHG